MTNSVMEIQGVSRTYATADGGQVFALDEINLDIADGEFVSVIGPSGCGKTTLFNLIGGLDQPTTGRVLVDGRPVDGSHKDIGMVFQEESTFPWRTVRENIEFPLEITGMAKAERREKAEYIVSLVGLAGFSDRYPAELSGGMRQRTALARTLAFEPRILLMDEPFASLDEQTRLLLGDKLLQICGELNQTAMLITHNITEAVQLSNRVLVMSFRPGRIKKTVTIDLPRPRSSEIVSSDAFGHYVGGIWEELRTEASRGLEASERL